MKLIILYGSEASGKLTRAKALVSRTILKLFHNHISIDVGRVLFDYGQEAFIELVWKVRLLVFESAAKNVVPGIVFTWAYSHPDFQPLLDRLLATVAPYNTQVHYVFVQCSQADLEQRVTNDDRARAGKAHTIEQLHQQQQIKNHVEIPGMDSLHIDSSKLTAEEAAHRVIREFKLERTV